MAKKLGVTVAGADAELGKEAGASPTLQGVVVQGVDRDGPAYQKLFPGDIITGVTFPMPGSTVHSVAELQQAIAKFKNGDVIQLSVNKQVDAAGRRGNGVVNLRVGN